MEMQAQVMTMGASERDTTDRQGTGTERTDGDGSAAGGLLRVGTRSRLSSEARARRSKRRKKQKNEDEARG
jgi:hypothetical protein